MNKRKTVIWLCLVLIVTTMFCSCGKNKTKEIVLEVILFCDHSYIYYFRLDTDNYLFVARSYDYEHGKIQLSKEVTKEIKKLAKKCVKTDPDSILYYAIHSEFMNLKYKGKEVDLESVFDENAYGENTAPYDFIELLRSVSPIEIEENPTLPIEEEARNN